MKLRMADFDGTWDIHPELWSSVSGIITGNSWENYQEFMDRKSGPSVPVFFNLVPYGEEDLDNIVTHKAKIINKLNVTDYYEDQSEQAEILTILCPHCTMHLVKDGETAI